METIAFNPISMLDRIKQAKDLSNLMSLTREGFTYQYASNQTRSRWEKATFMRKKELSNKK